MVANFGFGALFITFLVALYGVASAVYGQIKKSTAWVESARLSMLLSFPLLTLAAASIVYLLVNNQYSVEFVAEVTSRSMPIYLKVTALWGGQAGSLVFWSWLMAAFTTAVTLRKWDRDREFLPWVILVSLITLAFFLMMIVFFENPFRRLWETPTGVISAMFQPANSTLFDPGDGRGLNPLLRHPGMIIHPPMLYLGFVAFVIPFAFAISALITGRTDDRWIRITRRWTLIAWLFLTLGLGLGGLWAYDVLGWGGYWGWDPVEIAAFLPWLTGTAFLHSVMIQEKRGQLKQWNMVLIILTYCLVIFGTFLTRSGVLSSVHSFAQSAIGPLFFGYIGLAFIASTWLLLRRWDELKSETPMTSLLSREALFLLNNLIFLSIAFICFWGVIYPLISELVTGQKVTFGPEWYESATWPLFLGLVILMGIAPLSAWGHSTLKTLGRAAWKPFLLSIGVVVVLFIIGIRKWESLLGFWAISASALITLYEFWRAAWARSRAQHENPLLALWRLAGRNRRRYGGYIIHLGVVLSALGIIGIEVFQSETQGTIALNEELKLAGYTMQFSDLAVFDTPDGRNVARAVVEIYKGDQWVAELYPRRDYFYESQQPMTIPGKRSTLADDFYVLLVDWQEISTSSATFKIYHNPLVNWLWLGGLVFIFGTLVAAWPDKDPEFVPARNRRQAGTVIPRV